MDIDFDIKLKEIILAQSKIALSADDADELFKRNDFDIKEELGIDSLLIVHLVVEIEEAFDIEFEFEALDTNLLRNYSSLRKIVSDAIGEKNAV